LSTEGYYRRAARTVFADGTWWWKALIVGAIALVPYIGAFAALGYYMILMRDASWGVDRGLPELSEYPEALRQAVNGFVVSLVWGLVLAVPIAVLVTAWTVAAIAQSGPGVSPVLPWWNTYVIWVPSMALAVLSNVAVLRAAIYGKPSAGLSLGGVLALIKLDLRGFRAVTLLAVGVQLLGLLLRAPITLVRFIPQVPPTLVTYGWGFVVSATLASLSFVVFVAYGMWAQGTNPASWPPLRAPAVAAPDSPSDVTPEAKAPATDSPFDDI